jgi:hypothetical protein
LDLGEQSILQGCTTPKNESKKFGSSAIYLTELQYRQVMNPKFDGIQHLRMIVMMMHWLHLCSGADSIPWFKNREADYFKKKRLSQKRPKTHI